MGPPPIPRPLPRRARAANAAPARRWSVVQRGGGGDPPWPAQTVCGLRTHGERGEGRGDWADCSPVGRPRRPRARAPPPCGSHPRFPATEARGGRCPPPSPSVSALRWPLSRGAPDGGVGGGGGGGGGARAPRLPIRRRSSSLPTPPAPPSLTRLTGSAIHSSPCVFPPPPPFSSCPPPFVPPTIPPPSQSHTASPVAPPPWPRLPPPCHSPPC